LGEVTRAGRRGDHVRDQLVISRARLRLEHAHASIGIESCILAAVSEVEADAELPGAIHAWLATGQPDQLFATFVRNGTWVDPTLSGYLEAANLLDPATPVDPLYRYVAASQRKLAANQMKQHPLAVTEIKTTHEHMQALADVTARMVKDHVRLVAGTDAAGPRLVGFSLHSELVDLVRANNFLIVNDNPYSLILNESPLSILSIEGADEVALELNSLSKSHNMAGWRIGWVAGKKEYIDAVLRVKSNMDSGMFLGLQHAAVEALKNGDDWFQKQNSIYRKRQEAASKILEELGCSFAKKQSGLFMWAKAPEQIADVEKWIDEILYGTKVFITPGFIFGDTGKRFIRISLCATEEKLNEALERIKKLKVKTSPSSANRQ